jgi:hypothetical protein
VLPQSVEFPGQNSLRIAVAPAPDSPEAPGHVKASFADAHRCAALTRPERSRVVGNYRSDGEIQRTICAKPAGALSLHQRDYSPVSCRIPSRTLTIVPRCSSLSSSSGLHGGRCPRPVGRGPSIPHSHRRPYTRRRHLQTQIESEGRASFDGSSTTTAPAHHQNRSRKRLTLKVCEDHVDHSGARARFTEIRSEALASPQRAVHRSSGLESVAISEGSRHRQASCPGESAV